MKLLKALKSAKLAKAVAMAVVIGTGVMGVGIRAFLAV